MTKTTLLPGPGIGGTVAADIRPKQYRLWCQF